MPILLSYHLTFDYRSTIVRMWYEIFLDLTKSERKSDCPYELSDAVQFSLCFSSLSLSLSLSLSSTIDSISFIHTYKYTPQVAHVGLNFALTKVWDKGKERTDERMGYRCSESLNRTCVVLLTVDSRTLTSAYTCTWTREYGHMISSRNFTRVYCDLYNRCLWTFWQDWFDNLTLFLKDWGYNSKNNSYWYLLSFNSNKTNLIWNIFVCWETPANNFF